jgi:Raf kinase inhibitor-like YbhB/YbcL family protein
MNRVFLIRAACLFSSLSCLAQAQQGDGTDVGYTTHVFKPAKTAFSEALLTSLKTPEGFKINVFASGLKNTRIIAVAPDGTVYVSRRDEGDVLMLKDRNGDGRADGEPVEVARRSGAHGIAIHDGKLYLVTVKEVFSAAIRPDGTLEPLKMILGDLPDAGQHANRTVAFGPDGMLYISVGSTCNACNENNPENAAILRASADGKSRAIFASGLRNTIGFAWELHTGELWGLDNGIDFLGDDAQPEELNHIQQGKQYGWPHIWGKDGVNPQSTPVGDISKDQWRANSVPMIMGYTAHAAPMQMLFYTGGSFPHEYVGDAFATMRGSWNRQKPSGYEIVRIRFVSGEPKSIEPFVTGFLSPDQRTHFARPMGLAQTPDGSLLMADDANGTIYRISYSSAPDATHTVSNPQSQTAPAAAMLAQARHGMGVALAQARVNLAHPKPLHVSAKSFTNGGPIPKIFSNYADNVSPELDWSAVEGAGSYVLIVEDPDAKPLAPIVHWVIWNIPSTLTRLPEGIQAQPRLTDPDGVLQGRNSHGSVGYFGPRPPVGEPPHHYHFQLFALDNTLDIAAGSDRDTVLSAATGHVLATAEWIGTYQQTVEPPR